MGLKGVAQKGKGVADKGKAVAGKGSSGAKRKRSEDGNEKSGCAGRRRNNPGVIKFFDDVAAETASSDSSDYSDFLNGETRAEPNPLWSFCFGFVFRLVLDFFFFLVLVFSF